MTNHAEHAEKGGLTHGADQSARHALVNDVQDHKTQANNIHTESASQSASLVKAGLVGNLTLTDNHSQKSTLPGLNPGNGPTKPGRETQDNVDSIKKPGASLEPPSLDNKPVAPLGPNSGKPLDSGSHSQSEGQPQMPPKPQMSPAGGETRPVVRPPSPEHPSVIPDGHMMIQDISIAARPEPKPKPARVK